MGELRTRVLKRTPSGHVDFLQYETGGEPENQTEHIYKLCEPEYCSESGDRTTVRVFCNYIIISPCYLDLFRCQLGPGWLVPLTPTMNSGISCFVAARERKMMALCANVRTCPRGGRCPERSVKFLGVWWIWDALWGGGLI